MATKGDTKKKVIKKTVKKTTKKTAKPKTKKIQKKELEMNDDIFELNKEENLVEDQSDALNAEEIKNNVDVTDETTRLTLIKAELHYFKGLSIMLTVLMLCVFFAFGALFSSMYLEAKMMRNSVESLISKTMIESTSDVYNLIGEVREENILQNQELRDNLVEEVLQRLEEGEVLENTMEIEE